MMSELWVSLEKFPLYIEFMNCMNCINCINLMSLVKKWLNSKIKNWKKLEKLRINEK